MESREDSSPLYNFIRNVTEVRVGESPHSGWTEPHDTSVYPVGLLTPGLTFLRLLKPCPHLRPGHLNSPDYFLPLGLNFVYHLDWSVLPLPAPSVWTLPLFLSLALFSPLVYMLFLENLIYIPGFNHHLFVHDA